MKWVDPSIELVACGSSSRDMPTFGDWELSMLDECYENVDYVSLHRYYGNQNNDTPSFLAQAMDMDAFIRTVTAICDAIGGKKRSKKTLNLSFDEWNVWYHSNEQDKEIWKREKWNQAPSLLEDIYNFEDALLVGSLLITFLRNADRVRIACMAQLVNVIAPIMTRKGGGVWAQTIFWPLMQASAYGRGVALQTLVDAPLYDCAAYDSVPELDAMATMEQDGSLSVFAVNRSMKDAILLSADLRSFDSLSQVEHSVLHHADVKATNTEQNPDHVLPFWSKSDSMDNGRLEICIPALSWNVIRLSRQREPSQSPA